MKKHVFAEKFRGLYSSEIDNMIDEINTMVQKKEKLNESIDEKSPDYKDKLKEYFELCCKVDETFEEMYRLSNGS